MDHLLKSPSSTSLGPTLLRGARQIHWAPGDGVFGTAVNRNALPQTKDGQDISDDAYSLGGLIQSDLNSSSW